MSEDKKLLLLYKAHVQLTFLHLVKPKDQVSFEKRATIVEAMGIN
jgi:hypothetical protein